MRPRTGLIQHFRAVFCGRFGDGDTVKQRTGLVGRQYRCLAFFNNIFGTAHGMRRIDVDDMPGNKPIEQHPERGQVLLTVGGESSSCSSLMKAATWKGWTWESS